MPASKAARPFAPPTAGELSALCGVAGSYTEHLPVFHLVGMPSISTQRSRRIVHHTLGDGLFDAHAASEAGGLRQRHFNRRKRRLPDRALHRGGRLPHRPVYMALPQDQAGQAPARGIRLRSPGKRPKAIPRPWPPSLKPLPKKVSAAGSTVVLAGYLIARLGLRGAAKELLTRTGLPFATMFMDKTALDETLPGYVGLYDGRIMNPEVRDFVEGCDCVLNLGAIWSDFNTGAFTAHIDPSRMIADAARVCVSATPFLPMWRCAMSCRAGHGPAAQARC